MSVDATPPSLDERESLSRVLAGPLRGMVAADLGAQVELDRVAERRVSVGQGSGGGSPSGTPASTTLSVSRRAVGDPIADVP